MSKPHNTQPMTAPCHLGCINYLPSLSYRDLSEASQPLLHVVPLCGSAQGLFALTQVCQHSARAPSSATGSSVRCQLQPRGSGPLLFSSMCWGLTGVQDEKDLGRDLQLSPKLHELYGVKTFWDHLYSSSNCHYLFKLPLQTTCNHRLFISFSFRHQQSPKRGYSWTWQHHDHGVQGAPALADLE